MTDKADNHREGTDEALVVKYQRGDRTALSVLVRRHSRTLYTTAYYLCGSEDIAELLTLEVFKQVIEHAGEFHIEMHFRTWMFAFLHQQIVTRGSIGSSTLPQSTTSDPRPPEPTSANTLTKLGRSQLLSRRVTSSVSTLPVRVREALVLKIVGQLTIPEIAFATVTTTEDTRELLREGLSLVRDAICDTEEYARALR